LRRLDAWEGEFPPKQNKKQRKATKERSEHTWMKDEIIKMIRKMNSHMAECEKSMDQEKQLRRTWL
jgi:hypothetical protein